MWSTKASKSLWQLLGFRPDWPKEASLAKSCKCVPVELDAVKSCMASEAIFWICCGDIVPTLQLSTRYLARELFSSALLPGVPLSCFTFSNLCRNPPFLLFLGGSVIFLNHETTYMEKLSSKSQMAAAMRYVQELLKIQAKTYKWVRKWDNVNSRDANSHKFWIKRCTFNEYFLVEPSGISFKWIRKLIPTHFKIGKLSGGTLRWKKWSEILSGELSS